MVTDYRNCRFYGVSFNRVDRSTRLFGPENLSVELEDTNVFSWIDIEGPDISVLNEVLRLVDVDLVLVSHFHTPEILPRIVERQDCLAFYLYEVCNPEQHLDTTKGISELEFGRMILVISSDYILTYHQRPIEAVEHVMQTCEESFRFAGKTPGFIAFLFLNRCLYDYAHLNLANDNYLDLLQVELQRGAGDTMEEKIAVVGSNILTLKKLTSSLHIVLMLLATKRSPFISDEARVSFTQMLQNTMAVRGSIDSSRDLLDGILASMQTEAAKRTSDIARVLTVVSTIILPLTLIAGIYGMNFENMPELKTQTGYFVVLSVMVILAVAMLLLFVRLGWIGTGASKKHRK